MIWADNMLERYRVPPGEDEKGVAWGRAGSPLIVDDLVVVPAGGPADGPKVSLAAFHKENGDLVWEGGSSQVSYSSPVLATLAGTRQIVSVNEATVTGHDPETGKELWAVSWPGLSNQESNASQPAIAGPAEILVSKGYSQGAMLLRLSHSNDSWNTEEVWRHSTVLKTKFTNVVIHDGHVYGLSDGILECVELASGKRQWKKGRFNQGQILGVRDLVLVQAESGDIALVEASPEAFRELGRFHALDGISWNNLCLSGKRLLVRNSEQAACYELP
jgi:outer membrane protein assembly factor BamB